ncbi:MAG: response regulator [Granulosicoccus sp.]|nr:response regulator [Granulosicoccus sp.]
MLAAQVNNESDAANEPLKGSILCVDDEAQILTSLKRLFRRAGHSVHLANSAAEGLEFLKENQVDLVISDMRMPEMDGNAFLTRVATEWPHTVRMLLTGYSDMESTVGAINNGSIYRYIAKPWDDQDILVTVQSALETKHLRDERTRLIELTSRQNEELQELNSSLEQKVEARTTELKNAVEKLATSNDQIKQAYSDSIAVFSRLINIREGEGSAHGERIAELADLVAQDLQLDDDFRQDLNYAALLHDIGKMGLSDELFKTPQSSLSDEQRELYEQHSVNGEAILLSLGPLSAASAMIRSHHEQYGGGGFPDQLKGDEIPLGARILSVVNDYDDLMSGSLLGKAMDSAGAGMYLKTNIGKRYDKEIVSSLLNIIKDHKGTEAINKELILDIDDVVAGMTLAEDVYLRENVLMLRSGQVMTESFIKKFKSLKADSNESRSLKIRM